jgi:hypothetical protein
MEAEEALGKLKRCPSLADLTAFLGTTVGSKLVRYGRHHLSAQPTGGIICMQSSIVFQNPNSKVPKEFKPLPYDFIASCHWLRGRNER